MKQAIYISIYFSLFALFALGLSFCNNPPEQKQIVDKPCSPVDSFSFIYHDNGIYIKVLVNDSVEGNFLFDTGINNVLLDSLFLKRLYPHQFQLLKNNTSKYTKVQNVIGKKIKFKISKEVRWPIILNNPLNVKKICGSGVDGILGNEILKDKIIKIDYKTKYITLFDPACFSPSPLAKESNLSKLRGMYTIEGILTLSPNLIIGGNFVLDSGNAFDVVLTDSIFKAFRIDTLVKKREFNATGMTFYGKTEGFTAKGISIELLKHKITEPKVVCLKNSNFPHKNVIGFIGNTILEQFTVYLDFANEKLYLEKDNSYHRKTLPASIDLLFSDEIRSDNNFIINGEILNSEAYNKGIRIGDLLCKMNGIPVTKLSELQRDSLLKLPKVEVQIKQNNISKKIILNNVKREE